MKYVVTYMRGGAQIQIEAGNMKIDTQGNLCFYSCPDGGNLIAAVGPGVWSDCILLNSGRTQKVRK